MNNHSDKRCEAPISKNEGHHGRGRSYLIPTQSWDSMEPTEVDDRLGGNDAQRDDHDQRVPEGHEHGAADGGEREVPPGILQFLGGRIGLGEAETRHEGRGCCREYRAPAAGFGWRTRTQIARVDPGGADERKAPTTATRTRTMAIWTRPVSFAPM